MNFSLSNFNPDRHTQKPDRPFSFAKLYQHPNFLKEKDPGGYRLQVGIIGGGIAGLTAAYELSQLGHEVAILEASDRLGGRIQTHYFSDGSHAELGAMRLPTSHGCVLHYAEKFNLPKRSFVTYNSNAFYYLRGQKTGLGKLGRVIASSAGFPLHGDVRSPDASFTLAEKGVADFRYETPKNVSFSSKI